METPLSLGNKYSLADLRLPSQYLLTQQKSVCGRKLRQELKMLRGKNVSAGKMRHFLETRVHSLCLFHVSPNVVIWNISDKLWTNCAFVG